MDQQEINEGDSESTRLSTSLSVIVQDTLNHPQTVLLEGQACWNKSIWTSKVVLLKKWTCADTVLTHPPLPNSRDSAAAMAPQLLKHQKTTLLNTLCKFDHAPSVQVLPLPKSTGDQHAPHSKACWDQNVAQQQHNSCEVAKIFVQPIVFMKSPWTMLSGQKYSMVIEAGIQDIQARDCQLVLAGVPEGILSVRQLPEVHLSI